MLICELFPLPRFSLIQSLVIMSPECVCYSTKNTALYLIPCPSYRPSSSHAQIIEESTKESLPPTPLLLGTECFHTPPPFSKRKLILKDIYNKIHKRDLKKWIEKKKLSQALWVNIPAITVKFLSTQGKKEKSTFTEIFIIKNEEIYYFLRDDVP